MLPERVERLTMSVQEAAEELGVCMKIMYDLTHREDFPAMKIGRLTRINREGLREWVNANTQNKKTEETT